MFLYSCHCPVCGKFLDQYDTIYVPLAHSSIFPCKEHAEQVRLQIDKYRQPRNWEHPQPAKKDNP